MLVAVKSFLIKCGPYSELGFSNLCKVILAKKFKKYRVANLTYIQKEFISRKFLKQFSFLNENPVYNFRENLKI